LKPDKALSMLGLAARAGRIVSGEFTVEKEVKSGRAYLVLIAEDASENTRKKFQNMFVEIDEFLIGAICDDIELCEEIEYPV